MIYSDNTLAPFHAVTVNPGSWSQLIGSDLEPFLPAGTFDGSAVNRHPISLLRSFKAVFRMILVLTACSIRTRVRLMLCEFAQSEPPLTRTGSVRKGRGVIFCSETLDDRGIAGASSPLPFSPFSSLSPFSSFTFSSI